MLHTLQVAEYEQEHTFNCDRYKSLHHTDPALTTLAAASVYLSRLTVDGWSL